MKTSFSIEEVKKLLKKQRVNVANELTHWTEDLSISNQMKIHELCEMADEPDLK